MSEHKILNKYYPPEFDPSKIPHIKLARDRHYSVRLLAPFSMRCKTCGEYIYKGKKFNARKEDVEGYDDLGIRIYRFYIKCTCCLQEISFKTNPKNTGYEIEAGATRNFISPLSLAEERVQRKEAEEEEEATSPLKFLEERTLQSKQEEEVLESLEKLKILNRRQQILNYDQMLEQYDNEITRQMIEKEEEELDKQCIQSVFGKEQLTWTMGEEIEELEELKILSRRQQIMNHDQMLEQYDSEIARQRTEKEEELNEQYIQSILGKRQLTWTMEKEIEELEKEEEGVQPPTKIFKTNEIEL